MAEIPAPTNKPVSVINAVLDALIMGLGVDMAYAAAVAYAPFLGAPVIGSLTKSFIKWFADILDTNLKINIDIIAIRYQNDIRKAEYEIAIKKLKTPGASDVEIKNAKLAIDRIVSRYR